MVVEKAYAKVNLFINVLDLRKDGYHNLEMVNVKIDLFDTIRLKKTNTEGLVQIRSNDMFLSNKNNVVIDTATYVMHRFAPDKGVIIDIDKKIPFGAGLAGNSADAASIIKGLNRLFNLKLSQTDMEEIAVQFGADIPYCLRDAKAIVESIGDKITEVDIDLKDKQLLLVNPKVYIPTKDIFSEGDKHGFDNIDSQPIRVAISNHDTEMFVQNIHNSLQKRTLAYSKEVSDAYEHIKNELGEQGLVMTGSGSTFVKIIDKDDSKALKFVEKYREKYFLNIYSFLD